MAGISNDVFNKFRKKLPKRQEADGQIEVEVREDEEQSVKLQEIVDLLVAAGYFRARIKGLSSFDKIVGGMTWCIESCNVDVDVDLLFQENSTIGQKIALTEKIVAVLPQIKCPHRIEPHQIQGLDFIHIFPVIQWLVKRSMEHRQDISKFVASYLNYQFNKDFPKLEKSSISEKHKQMSENVSNVLDKYRPHRYYKRNTAPPSDIQSRVHITLLEYGYPGSSIKSTPKENLGAIESQSLDEKHLEQLLSNMAISNEASFDINDLTVEEKEKIAKHYASLQTELKDGGIKSKEHLQILSLQEKKNIIAERTSKLESEKHSLEEELHKIKESIEEIRLKQQEADKALKELEENETKNSENLKEVEELVMLNDNLRNQELQFREHCKKELVRLQNLIEEGKKAKTPDDDNSEVNKQIEEESEKVKQIKLQLAKKNRTVTMLQRQLDDVPSRSELAQYQRRFLELYNQIAAKHKETKQYYTLYNTLEDTRVYMVKELSILNSISESYPEAMQSTSGQEEFLNQFQNILDGVKHSKEKLERKLMEERKKRDLLSSSLHNLIEQQRKYVAAVRQLSIECRKHEALLAQRSS